MPWDDSDALADRLDRALDAFNWKDAEEICKQIVRRIKTESELIPESLAKKLLSGLRRKRQFALVIRLSDALLQSGLRTAQIRRQYAQGLIDQGLFALAEMLLQTIIQDPAGADNEVMEARGLVGRIYKQLYVNSKYPKTARDKANLATALKEYSDVYQRNPQLYLWHGINVVACLERSRRDNLDLPGLADAQAVAKDILATLAERESKGEELPTWDIATRMEAYVALGSYQEAAETASRYVDSLYADAFELGSTIRQLTEIWQLNDQEPPGSYLLPILNAAYLSKVPGARTELNLSSATDTREISEKVDAKLSDDQLMSVSWLQRGVKACAAIASVEKLNGKRLGTGLLVNASDFFPDRSGVLLLTSEHVVNDPNQPDGTSELTQANFQSLGEVLKFKEVIWSSSLDLDAIFVSLEGEPKATPLSLQLETNSDIGLGTRLYFLRFQSTNAGTPPSAERQPLKAVLGATTLLAQNEYFLHYGTPDAGISSGSPIFDGDWQVLALHHRSAEAMPRIDGGVGTYEASEGILISAVQEAISEQSAAEEFESAASGSAAMRGRGGETSVDDRPVEDSKTSAVTLHAALEGEGAQGTSALYNANIDLVFVYAPESADKVPAPRAPILERRRKLQVPLGIMVVPVGFTFADPAESGYRQIRFYTKTVAEKVSFKLRATDLPDETDGAETTTPEPGFHIIFDLRGSIVSQSFLPAKLVRTQAELKRDIASPTSFFFDLDRLKQFDDHNVEAQERLAVALQRELS